MRQLFIACITLLTLLFNSAVQAQATSDAAAASSGDNTLLLFYTIVVLIFIVALLVLAVAFYTLRVLNIVLQERTEEAEATEPAIAKKNFWQKIWQRINDFKPVDREKEVMLDHNYDGIKELDNHLPPWWLALFYITIAFGVVYLFYYHVFDAGPSSEEEYTAELIQAEEDLQAYMATLDELIDETNVTPTTDPLDISNGKSIYETNCVACHRLDGGGGIGPNLTDSYWIHGGDISSIFATIKYGVQGKGMQSWQSKLSPAEMRDVSTYILTMQGTNPPDAKGPEGELYEREEANPEEPMPPDSEAPEKSSASDSLKLAVN